MQTRKKELRVQCVYREDGEDVRQVIRRSFRLFIRRSGLLRSSPSPPGSFPGAR